MGFASQAFFIPRKKFYYYFRNIIATNQYVENKIISIFFEPIKDDYNRAAYFSLFLWSVCDEWGSTDDQSFDSEGLSTVGIFR